MGLSGSTRLLVLRGGGGASYFETNHYADPQNLFHLLVEHLVDSLGLLRLPQRPRGPSRQPAFQIHPPKLTKINKT